MDCFGGMVCVSAANENAASPRSRRRRPLAAQKPLLCAEKWMYVFHQHQRRISCPSVCIEPQSNQIQSIGRRLVFDRFDSSARHHHARAPTTPTTTRPRSVRRLGPQARQHPTVTCVQKAPPSWPPAGRPLPSPDGGPMPPAYSNCLALRSATAVKSCGRSWRALGGGPHFGVWGGIP